MDGPKDLSLADELRRRGISPSRRLGQNFMVDRNMLDFLVRTAQIDANDVILEIGAGAGFLTQRLCEAAAHVIAVELDRGLYQLSAERLTSFPNLTLLHADALAAGDRFGDEVRAALKAALRTRKGRAGPRLKLVANLPYQIATTVVQAVLCDEFDFAAAYFTAQYEVARRLIAPHGSGDYGFISVLVALMAQCRIVRRLPPTVFWPRPKVESAIVELIPRPGARGEIDAETLKRALSLLFSQRRKTLHAALRHINIPQTKMALIDDKLGREGAKGEERVFKLAPRALLDVAEVIRDSLGRS